MDQVRWVCEIHLMLIYQAWLRRRESSWRWRFCKGVEMVTQIILSRIIGRYIILFKVLVGLGLSFFYIYTLCMCIKYLAYV